MYAHLQPGSLRVKVGERVHRGQVLGLVGNSGNLGSEGVPYVFSSFERLGRARAKAVKPNGSSWQPLPDAKSDERRLEIPRADMVIRFP